MPNTEKKAVKRQEADVVGAFPSATTLADYKAVDPRFVEMMIAASEREQRHRHWRERAPEWTARLGVVCGLLIGLAGLTAAGYIAAIGSAVPGAALGAADLLGLVGVFIYGSRQQIVPRRLLDLQHAKPQQLPERKDRELLPIHSSGDKADQRTA